MGFSPWIGLCPKKRGASSLHAMEYQRTMHRKGRPQRQAAQDDSLQAMNNEQLSKTKADNQRETLKGLNYNSPGCEPGEKDARKKLRCNLNRSPEIRNYHAPQITEAYDWQ